MGANANIPEVSLMFCKSKKKSIVEEDVRRKNFRRDEAEG